MLYFHTGLIHWQMDVHSDSFQSPTVSSLVVMHRDSDDETSRLSGTSCLSLVPSPFHSSSEQIQDRVTSSHVFLCNFLLGSWHGSRRQTSANKVSDHLMTDHQWHQRRKNSGLIWALIFVSWPWKVSRTSVSAAASAATITREENCCY